MVGKPELINVTINNVRWVMKADAVVVDKTKLNSASQETFVRSGTENRSADGPTLSKTKGERVGHPKISWRIDLCSTRLQLLVVDPLLP